MTIFELEEKINNTKYKDLKEFLKIIKLTQDQFIEIICKNEISEILKKFNKKTLNSKEVVACLDSSYATLMRNINSKKGPLFFQNKKGSRLHFPTRYVAIAVYIKEHPSNLNNNKIIKLLREILND